MKGEPSGTVVCLCSGGLDSTVVLAALARRGWNCTALFVDYGQAARVREERAFRRVCRRYDVRPIVRRISLWKKDPSSLLGGAGGAYLRHRNLALLLVADLVAEKRHADALAAGFCIAPDYPDCSRAFVALATSCLDVSGGIRRLVLTPLLELDKAGIGRLAAELDVPVDDTVSCYGADLAPCRTCRGCQDRTAAMEAYRGALPSQGARAVRKSDLRTETPRRR